jgi:transcriptional regulator of acetoin/glycerol metabolism
MMPETVPTLADKTEDEVRQALQAAQGRVQAAAVVLGVHRTQLQRALDPGGAFAQLAAEAARLRAVTEYETGRPREYHLTRAEVAAAWEASGYKLARAAGALGVSRNALRDIVHRYGLPHLPAPRRR